MSQNIHEHWFNDEWKEFKETSLITPENYEKDVANFKKYSKRASGRTLRLQVSKPLSHVGQLGDMVQGKEPMDFYFRSGAGVLDALADRLAFAEAGYLEEKGVNPLEHIAATTTPAGMAAIYAVAMELVRHIKFEERKGKRFLQGKTVYTHTNNVLTDRMKEMGLEEAVKVDTTDPLNLRYALQFYQSKLHKTEIVGIIYEPVTNPLIEYTDTRAIYQIAKEYGIPIIVDNTFLTPYLQQPFRMGADVIVHSMTKYLNGEGDMLGGAVIGSKEFIKSMREWQTTTGCVIQSPTLALSLFDRLGMLSERMEIHVQDAKLFADYLKNSKYVETVNYPDLEENTRDGSPGAVISFVMAGKDAGEKIRREAALMQYLIDNSRETGILYQVSLGDREHLMIGETTLGFGKSENLPAGLVRFAVGREPEANEVISFLKKAFECVYKN